MDQISGNEALTLLLEGNERYVNDSLTHPNQSVERRREVAQAQHPFAIILGCSDSRVPPEIVFDRGMGDLFVIRTAGQVADAAALGSIEYAVLHLHAPLLLVLGHQRCGAVTAAVQGGSHKGEIHSLLRLIDQAVRSTVREPGPHVDNAIAANARLVADALLSRSSILRDAQRSGALTVASAVYSLDTGRVQLLPSDSH